MSTIIDGIRVADEDELLEFANLVRQAGAATPLSALLPSIPSNPNQCLIARNLNFDCKVIPTIPREYFPDGSTKWAMLFDRAELRDKISKHMGLKPVLYEGYPQSLAVILPREIGNAAHAFDTGIAFQAYATVREN